MVSITGFQKSSNSIFNVVIRLPIFISILAFDNQEFVLPLFCALIILLEHTVYITYNHTHLYRLHLLCYKTFIFFIFYATALNVIFYSYIFVF